MNSIKPGEMKDVEVREACRALDTLAHSINKNDLAPKDCDKRGEISWLILKRLMTEDNLFDPVNDVLLPIHGYPIIVDHALCHNAIKCMAQSNQRHLFDKALLILKTLEEHFIESQSKKIRPVGRSYALLLDAARHHTYLSDDMNTLCSRADGSPRAAEIIQNMISQDNAPLDQASFSISLKAILSSKGSQESTTDILASVEPLLLKMEAHNYLPAQVTMTPLLDHLSKRGDLHEITRILNWMEDMYQRKGWRDIRPNRIHFNTLINALSKSKNGGRKAMKLLNKMKVMYSNGSNECARPDLVTYNAVLNAIAKETTSSGNKRSQIDSDIGERAESLLSKMEDGLEGDHIVPDIVSYNTVLSAHMNSHAINAATKVQAILQRMSDRDVEPDLLSYTACINTLAKSKTQGSAQKAEDLLRKLEEVYAVGNEDLKPDVKNNSVIFAWANSSDSGAVQRACQLLNEMELKRKSGDRPDLIPDAVSYTSIIRSFTKQDNDEGVSLKKYILNKAKFNVEDSGLNNVLLLTQIESNEDSGAAAEKAEQVLRSMIKDSQNDPSKIKPNTITFNTVIDAWSKSNAKHAAAKAQEILKEMQILYEKGFPGVCPDTFSFASVLNAFANSPEANSAEKAEELLRHMCKLNENGNTNVVPNTICFATVIKAYSRCSTKGSAEKAESILRWMVSEYQRGNPDLKPNTICFTSVCDAWSKSGESRAIKKVEELISWMENLSASGHKDLSPNQHTYNTLITAVARSKDPMKATKALHILRHMQDVLSIKPSSVSFSNVLNACSFTHGTPSIRQTALKIAIVVLEEALENTAPNDRLNVVYGAFFQTCANLMQKEIEKAKIERVVEAVFHKCCDHGQVDMKLLSQIRRASSKQLYLKLFGNFPTFPNIGIEDIPELW
eukprot:CAMPEP_0176503992 /NCGR_PEP_ID=MMETSP0200_2-20121128/15682_1 /TAXON_ID=947934 /ORGANISM="Chaetoceros sp., Strain GSL56" /LENGTH=900 /DNA_ID=CAMNT_0017903367 /DNA_START=234 /DNA_END=2934 /DNA_ORIENTATION=+